MKTYLLGPPVCGLHGMFEENFGDSNSPAPYVRVTPMRLGSALLPFHCPRCERVIDFTDPAVRDAHCDTRSARKNHWCPHCGLRFLLNECGRVPLTDCVVGDDGAAGSVVERVLRGSDGLVDLRRMEKMARPRAGLLGRWWLLGTDVLGCC